jgi:hypothetical protein
MYSVDIWTPVVDRSFNQAAINVQFEVTFICCTDTTYRAVLFRLNKRSVLFDVSETYVIMQVILNVSVIVRGGLLKTCISLRCVFILTLFDAS